MQICNKVSEQLSDPLTVCGGCLPTWARPLITSCKFLFPFDVRRKYFYCQLGAPRALAFFNKELEARGEKKNSLKIERGDMGEIGSSKLKLKKFRIHRAKVFF